ncbi:MAG: cell division protein FtsL [Clostridia bacterium]|nr:cell division protein FtsL [Clostridia bacterium]
MECSSSRIGEVGRHAAARRATRGRRFVAACATVAIAAVVVLVAYLAQRAEIVRASDGRVRAESRLAALRNEYDRRSLELARLTSLDRIDRAARVQLGMVDPTATGVVMVDARPQVASASVSTPAARALSEPPTVLASVSGAIQHMAMAAASSLVAAWFANAPAQLPVVLD